MEKDIGGDGWGAWCCSEALTSILHPRAQRAMWQTGMARQVQGTRCEAKLGCSPSISSFPPVPLQRHPRGVSWCGVVGDAVHAPTGPSTSRAGAGDGVDGVDCVDGRARSSKCRFGSRSRFLQHHRHISNAFPSNSTFDPRCHTRLGAELV